MPAQSVPGEDSEGAVEAPSDVYPQAETANERKDSLEPGTFKYTITTKELRA